MIEQQGANRADLQDSTSLKASDSQVVTRVLNLYAGIGGNRKLWENVEVTAVENVPEIAAIYKDFFPDDEVVVADAHQYLLDHYQEFDFIWSSPPCLTHSRTIFLPHIKKRYPDMRLYEEIIFLQYFAKCRWVVENVRGYYTPLIQPQQSTRHYFWADFNIPFWDINNKVRNDAGYTLDFKMERSGFNVKDWHGFKGEKRQVLNNMIEPELGLYILEAAKGVRYHTKGNDLVAMSRSSQPGRANPPSAAPTVKGEHNAN